MTGAGRRLATMLNLEPGEGAPVLHVFGLAVLLTMGRLYYFSAANALFLDVHSADRYPWVYIISSLLVAGLGALHARLKKRFAFAPLLGALLAVLTVGMIAARIGVGAGMNDMLIMLLPVWFIVCWIFGWLVLWGLAGRMFNVQQAKRLFGLVGAGEVVGDAVGGFAMPVVVGAIGTENLMVVAAVTHVLAIGLLGVIARRFGSMLAEPATRATKSSGGGGVRLAGRYILLVIALSALMNMVYAYMDLAFFKELQQRFTETADKAAFLGGLWAVMSVFNFLFRVVLSGRLLARYGIRVGLLSLPAAAGLLMVATAVLGGFGAAQAVVFWTVVSLMVAWKILRDGLDKPGSLLLYQPMPAAERMATQSFIETISDSGAVILASLSLLALTAIPGSGTWLIGAVGAVLCVGWIGVGIALNREYPSVLAEAIAQRRFGEGDLTMGDEQAMRALHEGLRSDRPGEVVYCMQRLAEMDDPEVDDELVAALDHPAGDVRGEALRLMEERRREQDAPRVLAYLEAEADPALRARAMRTLAALDEEGRVEPIRAALDDPDREVRKGAITALLRDSDLDDVVNAGTRLRELQRSDDPADRVLAAEILGEVGNPGFHRAVAALLDDDHREVRRAALAAAGRLGNPRLWPRVVGAMAVRGLQADAMAALVEGHRALPEGEPAPGLEPLRRRFEDPDTGDRLRARLMHAVGALDRPNCREFLLSNLRHPDPDVRSEVFTGLQRTVAHLQPAERDAVSAALQAEAADTALLIRTLADLAAEEDAELAVRAAEQELDRARDRLVRLAAMLHDGARVLDAHHRLQSDDAGERAYGADMLEHELTGRERALLLPLLERRPPAEAWGRLPAEDRPQAASPGERLAEMAGAAERLRPWTRAAALDAVGRRGRDTAGAHEEGAVIEALEDPEPLVREAAVIAARRLAVAEHEDLRRRLADDDDRRVRAALDIEVTPC